MPFTQILPKVEPTYFQEVKWPDYETFSIGDPFGGATQQTDSLRGRQGTKNFWSNPFSAGTGADSLTFYRERMTAQFVGGTGHRGRNFCMDWPLSFPMEFQEEAPVLSEMRVMWDSFFIAKDAGNDATNDTGVRYVVRAGPVTPGWPANGFGLFGFTNIWRWRAFDNAGATLESVDLTWPAPIDEYAKVDILLYAANAISDAHVEMWVNNTLLISRSFATAAGVLPSWSSGGLANALYMERMMRAGAGMTVYGTDFRYRAGKYDIGGVEVT